MEVKRKEKESQSKETLAHIRGAEWLPARSSKPCLLGKCDNAIGHFTHQLEKKLWVARAAVILISAVQTPILTPHWNLGRKFSRFRKPSLSRGAAARKTTRVGLALLFE